MKAWHCRDMPIDLSLLLENLLDPGETSLQL